MVSAPRAERRRTVDQIRRQRLNVNAALRAAGSSRATNRTTRSLPLPSFNPFVRPYNKDITPKEGEWSRADFRDAEDKAASFERGNKKLIEQMEDDIFFAGETHLAHMEQIGRHVDDETKRIAEIYLTRFNFLSDAKIKKVLRWSPAVNHSNYESNRNWLQRYQSSTQHRTTMYLSEGLLALVKATGGMERWKAASESDRANVILHCFDQYPAYISKLAFHVEDNACDIEGIWRSKEDGREKWQTFFRSVFVGLAGKVFQHKTSYHGTNKFSNRKAQAPLHRYWKAMKRSDGIVSLDLGDVENVPSRPSKTANGARKTIFDEVEIDIHD